jgi:non-ribosomal peptide synthase protein (TIGR01720 family)
MVPALWVTVKRLPKTPAGKVDRQALALLDPRRAAVAGAARVRPRNPLEAEVADVWAEVLGVAEVDVHDNFFDLGGDSILSIRMIARLRERGLAATVEEAVQHQTVADLAPCCKPVTTAADSGPVAGILPPTPIQRWFFERHGTARSAARDHFNQMVLLEVPSSWSVRRIAEALRRIESHHDALRLRWRPGDDVLEHAAPEAVAVEEHDLADFAPAERPAAMEAIAARLHASLDIERGPIARTALFRFPDGASSRLLWVIHHLAVDAVSWRFLVADLVALCEAASSVEVALPKGTTSYQAWAERLAAHAASPTVRRELDFWCDRRSDPARWPDPPASPSADVDMVRVALDAADTDLLVRGLAGATDCSVEAALLTAVAAGFAVWSGERRLLVDLERHGRASLFPDVDVSRTVGWFTALHPLEIALDDSARPVADLEAVEATLRAVPNHGVGWGLLRYLSPEPSVRDALALLPAPRVSFNYQGRIDRVLPTSAVRLASEPAGPPWPEDATSPYAFEIHAMVLDGCLEIEWRDTGRVYGEDVLRALAGATRATLDALVAETRALRTAAAESPSRSKATRGTRATIFCLPGGGGNPMYLQPLARRLDAGHPFVALSVRGLDGRAAPHRTIESMAADFLEAIRAEQPRGPYLLAGHSLGGWAAFHLAWLLRRQGEAVVGLIVFDTPAPLAVHRRRRADHDRLDEGRWLGGIVKLIERVSGTEFPAPEEALVDSTIDDFLERFHGYLLDLHLLPPGADLAHARGLLEVSKANTEAMLRYEAPRGRLDVPVQLLRAEALHPDDAEVMVVPPDDPLWGWSMVTTGETASRVVPGDHVTMFSTAHVPALARALEGVLQRLDLSTWSSTSLPGSTRGLE